MTELTGICAALCTPMDDRGRRLHETRLKKHIDSMLAAGVHIILVGGGTGEFAFLTADERRRLAEVAGRHIAGRARFMVQSSALNGDEAVEFSKHAEGAGADALLVLPPYFEGPDEAGVIRHYEKIAGAVKTPIMLYNIPVHSGFDVTPALYKRLLGIDNIVAIKDSTGDMVRIQQLLAVGGTVFNGADPLAFHAMIAGCDGCVWGAVNAMPAESVRLWDLVQTGEWQQAHKLWQKMLPAQIWFWTHVYNAGVKTATNLSGRAVGPCREPVQALDARQLRELKRALKPLGITGRV